jgi:uncharacterized protein (DUF433 family)
MRSSDRHFLSPTPGAYFVAQRASDYTLSMLDWTACTAVERSPEKVSGAWLFRGTRVPVKTLFENLEDGATVDQFLQWFPGVTRAQALAVLEFAEASLARV